MTPASLLVPVDGQVSSTCPVWKPHASRSWLGCQATLVTLLGRPWEMQETSDGMLCRTASGQCSVNLLCTKQHIKAIPDAPGLWMASSAAGNCCRHSPAPQVRALQAMCSSCRHRLQGQAEEAAPAKCRCVRRCVPPSQKFQRQCQCCKHAPCPQPPTQAPLAQPAT